MSKSMQNLMPSRKLTVIEQNLVEDLAEQCQSAADPAFSDKFAMTDELNAAIHDQLVKAIAAGFVWGTRTGFSAGYNGGVAMMQSNAYGKENGIAAFSAVQRDTEFIDEDYDAAADETLLRFYRPARLEAHA